jgi:uncharacterized membrane protein
LRIFGASFHVSVDQNRQRLGPGRNAAVQVHLTMLVVRVVVVIVVMFRDAGHTLSPRSRLGAIFVQVVIGIG